MQIRTLFATAACALAALTAASPAAAQQYKSEYKMSLVVPPSFPWGKGGEIWADLVRERTNGRINMKLYPGVSLVQGDQTREFNAIRQGVIDVAIGSTINWSPQIRELNLFALPFLMPDHAAIDALVKGEIGKRIMQIVEKAGVVPLAWGENGFRQITNSKHDIRAPQDLKGLKLRIVGSPLFMDTFAALGANPVQMSWADAQPALASGAVDGQENPMSIFTAANLHTVGQRHVTLWNYVADPLIFVVNRDVWNSWTKEDQEIVRQAAIDAGQQEIAISRKGVTSEDRSVLDQIAGLGVTITELTPQQHQAFVDATKPVFDKWKARIGVELVEQAQRDIANRGR